MRKAVAATALVFATILVMGYRYPAGLPGDTAPTQSAALDREKLEAMAGMLHSRRTSAFVVMHNGRVVFERYRPGYDADSRFSTASMAKALVGGIALLELVSEGLLDIDDHVHEYIPHWKDDPLKSQVRIRHLATHTSGLEDACVPAVLGEPCADWKQRYWPNRHNEIGFHISKFESTMAFAPGEQFLYSNPAYSNVLAYVMTKALEGTPYANLRELLREEIAEHLRITPDQWTINARQTFHYKGLELVTVGGGSDISARSAARLGQLLINEGLWRDQRLLSADAIQRFLTNVDTRKSTDPGIPKYPKPGIGGWWLNEDGNWPSLPRDAFLAAGGQHAITLVIPSLDLVAVRFGGRLGSDDWNGDYWTALETYFFAPLMDAVQGETGTDLFSRQRSVPG